MEYTYFSCICFNLSFSYFSCFLGLRLGSKFPFIWNFALSTCSLWPWRSYPSSNFTARSTVCLEKKQHAFIYMKYYHQPNFEKVQLICWHESVPATRILLMASSSRLLFFSATAQHLQWSALFRIFSIIGHSCRNPMPWRYELLPQWQPKKSKAKMSLLYKIPPIQGCPRSF